MSAVNKLNGFPIEKGSVQIAALAAAETLTMNSPRFQVRTNGTGGALAITLPDVAEAVDTVWYFCCLPASINLINISDATPAVIVELAAAGEWCAVASDGTDWIVLENAVTLVTT